MAKVFRTYKEQRGDDGKRVKVLDKDGQPIPLPKWRAVILEWTGKRKMVTLCKNRTEAQRQADLLQARQDDIRNGVTPPPTTATRAGRRPFQEVADEYLNWGNTQGGRGGRPWSTENAKKRRYYVDWWRAALKAETLGDLDGALPGAEKALRELAAEGKAGKTLALYREGLFAFCLWCKDRRYLRENPFAAMGKFNTAPRRIRRDMTLDEITRLLAASPPYRAILYEASFSTGFRAMELRSLSVASLDRERCGLHLSAEADKGRKARFQPITPELAERLAAFGAAGEAMRLYQRNFMRVGRAVPAGLPAQPLLYVANHPSQSIQVDLTAAGIPRKTAEGWLDFHACRVAYINLVIGLGVDGRTAQTLARHSSLSLTMDTYGRDKDERLTRAAREVGRLIQGFANQSTTNPAISAEFNKNAIPYNIRDCMEKEVVGRGGFEPP